MKVIKCADRKNCKKCDLGDKEMDEIGAALKSGELVIFPTDTLYGLAGDPFNENSVKKVFMVKNRPFDMPLMIAVSNEKMMESVAVLNDNARKLIRKFLPGPLTVTLTKKPSLPDMLTAGTNQIGIRIPDHPLALKMIDRFGPVTATSANIHSHPDPVDASVALKDLKNQVAICIDCGRTRHQVQSTIIDVSDGPVEIIRKGVISQEEIENALR